MARRSSLAQMQRTVPVITQDGQSKIDYGLGLHKVVVSGCGTFWGHDGTVWGAATLSLTSADGRRQLSVALNLVRWNTLDSSGRPQHSPIDDALNAFYQQAMCANPNARHNPGPGWLIRSHTSRGDIGLRATVGTQSAA